MIFSNTGDQVGIKNMGLEPKVIYQNWMFFLFKIPQLGKKRTTFEFILIFKSNL